VSFYGSRRVVLGHIVFNTSISVDEQNMEVIEKLPPPTFVKAVGIFLIHGGFYRLFIEDFSKIANPLSQLLVKDVRFDFNKECLMFLSS